MLYNVNYILHADIIENSLRLLKNKDIVIVIDFDKPFPFAAAYHSLMTFDSSNYFYFFIDGAADENTQYVNEITPFFFSTQYKKVHNLPKVLLRHPGDEKTITGLRASAISQGFVDLNVDYSNETGNEINASDEKALSQMMGSYQQKLNSPDPVFSEVYVIVSKLEDIDLIDQRFEKEEEKFRGANAKLFDFKTEYKRVMELYNSSTTDNQAASQEVANLWSHIDTLKSNSEATEIQQYYDHEYEALPKWYKQFGHIIKVITGKRRLKSLFSEKEKKYKE